MAAITDFSTPTPQNTFTAGPASRARVGGSGFTVFTWESKPVIFARQVTHQAPAPVAGVVPIHPMDSTYPVELVTPQAISMGTLMLELYEQYNANVWDRLLAASGAATSGVVDLAGVFKSLASNKPLHIHRIIRPPKLNNQTTNPYYVTFHGCVVSSVDDGETIEVGTMEVLKRLTVNYTYLTRNGNNVMVDSSAEKAL